MISEKTQTATFLNVKEKTVQFFFKRVFDYSFAAVATIISFPLMLLISLLIKATSKGAVIYTQERVGKDGKIFKMYKFRTMYPDADERLKKILENDTLAKQQWDLKKKLKNDPRVTPIGKILRKTSLDELPQLINVLKGQMSIVGPRPYLPSEIEETNDCKEIILSVLPGITGLWQTNGRSNTTFKERIEMDCYYVKNWSLWMDTKIFFKTFKAIVKGDGAY